jgi:hypothetical protein
MKYLNKLASIFFAAALGMLTLTSCEGGDLFNVNAPDWLSEMAGKESGEESGEEELTGMMEDVYTVGATDYSTGWWTTFSKYYVIPEATKWAAQFNLNINPSAPNTYKNFALIITNDEDRGATGYQEYGAIRFDHQPEPGNSEWGNYIDRSLVESTLTFSTDTDEGVQKLGGKVTLTIDRTEGGLIVKIDNGTVTKIYKQTSALANLNADASNTNIRAFLVPEGSYINWLSTNIEPIGGCTEAGDKEPVSMVLKGVPAKVLQGTDFETLIANVTAEVTFEGLPSPVTVKSEDLKLETIPDMNGLGTKTLVAAYSKTYKGEGAAKPVIAYVTFDVVDKMYTSIGATDNSTPFWGAHSENIKVAPGETFVSNFTNYTNGVSNWNNFCVVLCKADNTEYAVVRADNYGWGDGYGACSPSGGQADWGAWLKAMDGAKVTTYVTNNGDGTADVKAVMLGTDGNTYVQEYNGINTVDPNDFYFRFTVDGSHIEFDNVIGADDNSTAFWGAHSEMINVPVGKTFSTRIKNFTNGASNWNNFCVVLTRQDNTEYAVVRADNYGWGDSYGACAPSGGQADWGAWLKAMDEAMVTVSVTNNGGSVDVKCIMVGNDGNTYNQDYIGISPTDGNDVYFRFTVDGSHLIFE